MKNKFLLILASCLFSIACLAFPEVDYLDITLDRMPEARVFQFYQNYQPVRGIHVGDPKDPLIVFSGGYGSNILAYRLWIREWVKAGFQVLAFNTPGFGHGELKSFDSNSPWPLDINTQILAMESVIRFGYMTSGQPVIVAGHSYGGMMARFATLGLRSQYRNPDAVDPAVQAEMRKMVATVVPLMSPSPFMLNGPTREQQLQMNIGIFGLTRLVPALAEAHRLTPDLMRQIQGRVQSVILRGVESALDPKGEYLGLPDADFNEISQIFPDAISDAVPEFLPKLMRRWKDELRVTTANGFNLGAAWYRQQANPNTHIRTVMVIGEKDKIADVPAQIAEVQAIEAEQVTFETEHVASMISPSHARIIAAAMRGSHWQCTIPFAVNYK